MRARDKRQSEQCSMMQTHTSHNIYIKTKDKGQKTQMQTNILLPHTHRVFHVSVSLGLGGEDHLAHETSRLSAHRIPEILCTDQKQR
jgi:hypothetical protein